MRDESDGRPEGPRSRAVDKDGKPIMSWRVAIEQDNVYKQFKLDEPWDSANNKKV